MRRQHGQAAIATLLLLFSGVVAGIFYFANATRTQQAADQTTADALARAKEALIGFAVAVDTTGLPGTPPPPNPRPGELPCPNRIALADGTPSGIATTPCSTPSQRIGWFPWKTLGLPPLRDGSGEYLWYTLSDGFQNSPRRNIALNSDTLGSLTIQTRATGDTEASNVIAIVFAPGGVTNGQIRDSVVAPCSTTGTNIERNICGANYLEGKNAEASNDFETDPTITSKATITSFNDRLLPITNDALFAVVNIRVAKEAIIALENYRSSNGYYPFANAYGTTSPYRCNYGTNRGRFPITTVGGTCGQANWPANALPAWFSENNWNLVTHYGMSKACGQLSGAIPGWLESIIRGSLCGVTAILAAANISLVNFLTSALGLGTFTNDPLNVVGVTDGDTTRALVIVSGRALASQNHTCGSAMDCLEDSANNDGDANYAKPSRFPTSNDRMAICNAIACPATP